MSEADGSGCNLALILLLGVGCGCYMLYKSECAHGSGVRVNGHELSKHDAELGGYELERMIRNARPGDLSSIDLSFQPQTELGKEFRALCVDVIDKRKEINKHIDATCLLPLLKPSCLVDDRCSAQSKARADTLAAESKPYFQQLTNLMNGLAERLKTDLSLPSAPQAQDYGPIADATSDFAHASAEVAEACRGRSRHLDPTKAYVLFDNGSDQERYDTALAKFREAAGRLDDATGDVNSNAAKQIDSGRAMMNSAGN